MFHKIYIKGGLIKFNDGHGINSYPVVFRTFKVSTSSKVFIGLKLDKLRLFGDELKLHSQVVTQSSATLHVIHLDISGIILVMGV